MKNYIFYYYINVDYLSFDLSVKDDIEMVILIYMWSDNKRESRYIFLEDILIYLN